MFNLSDAFSWKRRGRSKFCPIFRKFYPSLLETLKIACKMNNFLLMLKVHQIEVLPLSYKKTKSDITCSSIGWRKKICVKLKVSVTSKGFGPAMVGLTIKLKVASPPHQGWSRRSRGCWTGATAVTPTSRTLRRCLLPSLFSSPLNWLGWNPVNLQCYWKDYFLFCPYFVFMLNFTEWDLKRIEAR